MQRRIRLAAAAAVVTGTALVATACASPAGGGSEPTAEPSASATTAEGRVAVSYEGGVAVLDGETLEVLAELPSEEFTRVNDFGDGRTISVTTSEGFQMLDTAEPALTDIVFEAAGAGHVVTHHGHTVLFDDATGTTTILHSDAFADGYDEMPEVTTYEADSPHHGVSIVLEDHTLVTTIGTEESRSGSAALHAHDDHWDEVASSAECPGIHGEGTAADEVVVFGCENGALLFKDGEYVKLAAPDPVGRMGSAWTSEDSPLVVGDYQNDPDAEGYLLNAVAIIDTAAETFQVVDLPDEVQYTFRDVARGPGDLAYILSADGRIHVLDPETGELTESFPVIGAWEGPAEWQEAHPAIKVNGDIAYVTEPAANSVHAVDLTTGEIVTSVELDHTPNEIAVALG
ncbi:zinc metallochaperone AztD [Agromyces sp. LHK192]|uniref:zinc metallochaperone AztD n=1 Tax=Agromyces sp. LHK192 TaxID=2498704 RepID=UPI000FD9237D|nr:zinc metallochaperone AztD [Agromyces sp. LHK192]